MLNTTQRLWLGMTTSELLVALVESEMEKPQQKKRFIVEEKRTFQKKWINLTSSELGGQKVKCLICKQVNSVLKEFNVQRHSEISLK